MVLLPREHGAYGQCAVPLLTAFVVAGVSAPNALIAATVVAAFLAHEPAAVLLGARGGRAAAALRRPAIAGLAVSGVAAAACGLAAFALLSSAGRWALLIPAIPAAVVAALTIQKGEKSSFGEVASAAAFAGAAVPMIVANGGSLRTASTVAIPFAALFIAGIFAVHAVISSVRNGGDPRAVRRLRWGVYALAAAVTLLMVSAARGGLLPQAAIVAVLPGLGVSVAIAARPPRPSHLRLIGWMLVAASLLTAVLAATAVS